MKTLKVLLQEVVSGIKAWVNSNFAQESNAVHKTGNETITGDKTFSGGIYSSNYYYNGTAWGLDKSNVWSTNNEFKAILALGNSGEIWFNNNKIDDFTTNPAEHGSKSVLQLWNKDTSQYSGGFIDCQMTDGSHIFEIVCFGYPLNDTTAYQHRFRFAAFRDGRADFYPTYNNVNLGTSTNKWKTLNGVNPGALSFPNLDYSNTNKWKDIRGDITNQTGGDNEYYPTEDGWIFLLANGNPTILNIFARIPNVSGTAFLGCGSELETASGARWLFCPAPKGAKIRIRYAKGTGTLEQAIFITCQGNV